MIDFAAYPLPVVFLASLIAILGASELARPFAARAGGCGGASITTLEAATLGLLALMISFTFAMALSRFDGRRDAVLEEANAIGTTALRARLLPGPYSGEALKLLREYATIRVNVTRRPPSASELATAVARSNAIQGALWRQAEDLAQADSGMVPTGIFIQSLNQMIDAQGKRLTELRNRVPNIVLAALYGVAIVAGAFTGYADAREARAARLPIYTMGVIVAAMILLIQDLDRPGSGFITISQQSMLDTLSSIDAYLD